MDFGAQGLGVRVRFAFFCLRARRIGLRDSALEAYIGFQKVS